MKQFIVPIFLSVPFSGLVNAGQRKIAYERGEKIFVADAGGAHPKKIAEGNSKPNPRFFASLRMTALL